jgi:hypothetical protein
MIGAERGIHRREKGDAPLAPINRGFSQMDACKFFVRDFITKLIEDILAELRDDNTPSAQPGREAVYVLRCWFRALRTSIPDVAG